MDRPSIKRSKVDLRRRPLYWAVHGGSVQYQAVQSGPARLTPVQLVQTMLDRRSSRIGSQTPSAIRKTPDLQKHGRLVKPGGPRWIGPVPSGPKCTFNVNMGTWRSKVDRFSTKRARVDLRRRCRDWAIQGGSVRYPAVQRGPRWSTSTLSGPRWTSAVVGGPEWTCKVDLRPRQSDLSWTRSGRDVGEYQD